MGQKDSNSLISCIILDPNLMSNWLRSGLMLPPSPWGFLTPSSSKPSSQPHHTPSYCKPLFTLSSSGPPFPQNIIPVYPLDKPLFTCRALFQMPPSLQSFPYSCHLPIHNTLQYMCCSIITLFCSFSMYLSSLSDCESILECPHLVPS